VNGSEHVFVSQAFTNLQVSPELDERLDIQKSTRAASRYLRELYSEFGDWPLALAAYNAGADRVAATFTRTTRRDFDYSGAFLRLPIETQRYVPAVLTAIEVIKGRNQATWRPAISTNVYATTGVKD